MCLHVLIPRPLVSHCRLISLAIDPEEGLLRRPAPCWGQRGTQGQLYQPEDRGRHAAQSPPFCTESSTGLGSPGGCRVNQPRAHGPFFSVLLMEHLRASGCNTWHQDLQRRAHLSCIFSRPDLCPLSCRREFKDSESSSPLPGPSLSTPDPSWHSPRDAGQHQRS